MSRTPRMLGIVAALLIVVGALVVVTAPPQSFGWFAYAPLAEDVHSSPGRPSLPVVLGGRQLLGLVAVVVGVVVAALAVGLRLGRHRTP